MNSSTKQQFKKMFYEFICTSKNVLAKIDATRSLAYSSTGNVEKSIKNIWMTIVESNPVIEQTLQ